MITRYSLVSSANIFVMYLTSLDRSLTKSKNKSGEIRAPCGTPDVILSSWSRPAATQLWLLSRRNEDSHLNILQMLMFGVSGCD